MSEIEAIVKILADNPLVCFAYLFGSRAKGEHGPRSDWDIAVYITPELLEKNPVWQKFRIEDKLAVILNTDAVEVVVVNRLDDPLLGFEIISRGQMLVCKDEEARITYEVNTLRRYQDWRHFQRRYVMSAV